MAMAQPAAKKATDVRALGRAACREKDGGDCCTLVPYDSDVVRHIGVMSAPANPRQLQVG